MSLRREEFRLLLRECVHTCVATAIVGKMSRPFSHSSVFKLTLLKSPDRGLISLGFSVQELEWEQSIRKLIPNEDEATPRSTVKTRMYLEDQGQVQGRSLSTNCSVYRSGEMGLGVPSVCLGLCLTPEQLQANHLKSRHPWFPQLDVDEDTIQGTFYFFFIFIILYHHSQGEDQISLVGASAGGWMLQSCKKAWSHWVICSCGGTENKARAPEKYPDSWF